jgi:hypothetical protein
MVSRKTLRTNTASEQGFAGRRPNWFRRWETRTSILLRGVGWMELSYGETTPSCARTRVTKAASTIAQTQIVGTPRDTSAPRVLFLLDRPGALNTNCREKSLASTAGHRRSARSSQEGDADRNAAASGRRNEAFVSRRAAQKNRCSESLTRSALVVGFRFVSILHLRVFRKELIKEKPTGRCVPCVVAR